MTRIFYGVYPKESRVTAALELVRYLAEPDNLRIAHITLRGPYTKTLPKTYLQQVNNDLRREWKVRLDGPGFFFNETQNTVLIKVDLLQLNDLVHKPDFEGGQAHITLYDGKDRAFAEQLLHVLFSYSMFDNIPVSHLVKLPSKTPLGEHEEFASIYGNLGEIYDALIRSRYGRKSLSSVNETERLNIVKEILDMTFNTHFSKLEPRHSNRSRMLSFGFMMADPQFKPS